jgi:hypothetical protein
MFLQADDDTHRYLHFVGLKGIRSEESEEMFPGPYLNSLYSVK